MYFIKRHQWLSAVLFLVPIVILILLCAFDFLTFDSTAAPDWITMIAGLLTYYGTVILAVVTAAQNDKLIEFQERQEERDKIQQEIAKSQLQIAERQKEIADRQLQHIEREQEIEETSLRNSHQPNFDISLRDENEEVVELTRCKYLDGYDHEFKARVSKVEEPSTFYLIFENKSETDAYDVSLIGVEPYCGFDDDKIEYREYSERRNKYYSNLTISAFKRISSGSRKVMTLILSKEEKSIAIHFTASFRNAYNHWFYQDIIVCIEREDHSIEIQLQINDSKQGHKDVNERGIILYEDGKSLVFPPKTSA